MDTRNYNLAFILVTPLENRALNRYDTPKNKIEIY